MPHSSFRLSFLLPITLVGVASLGLFNASYAASVVRVEFSETPAPQTAEQMAMTRTTSIATITYSDGKQKAFPLQYHKLFGVKDKVGNSPFAAGQVFNNQMQPVIDASGKPAVIETPDGNSLLAIGDKLYLVTHYEYDWIDGNGGLVRPNRMPMGMTLTEVHQNKKTGKLTAVKQQPINFASTGGLWIACAASQTPWNTHLGSEEDYDMQFNPLNEKSYAKTQGGVETMKNIYGNAQAAPYQYGYLTEVVVDKKGHTTPIKHYGMGRGTWELGRVMPDGKTVYFGDDGVNTGFFMFISNQVNDLSHGGTLYAAKWLQTSPSGADGGAADLQWIKLGTSESDAQIKAFADANTFNTLFDNAAFDNQTQTCTSGTRIRAGSAADECLTLKAGQETAAAFLESRRMAALKGATTEFNKLEGVTVNVKDKQLYLAMSYIDKGMLENEKGGADHIKLAKNSAGATYTLTLASHVQDSEGNPMPSDYVAKNMYVEPALLGEPIALDALGNSANPEKIANTDNIFFSEGMRTLFIGEDSDTHVNNFLWAYNVDSKKLTRIMSIPSGAESTGLQVLDDLHGHAYIMSNSQHHGDFTKTLNSDLKAKLTPMIDKFDADIGYFGGLPAIK